MYIRRVFISVLWVGTARCDCWRACVFAATHNGGRWWSNGVTTVRRRSDVKMVCFFLRIFIAIVWKQSIIFIETCLEPIVTADILLYSF